MDFAFAAVEQHSNTQVLNVTINYHILITIITHVEFKIINSRIISMNMLIFN